MNFLSDKARNITPYTAGEQLLSSNVIKLNTNENPYPPSAEIRRFLDAVSTDKFRLYPNANSDNLKSVISSDLNISPSNIFLGNGSDEVLALSFLAFFNPNAKPICFADITYSFYSVYANLFNINFDLARLNDKFEIDVNDYHNRDCQAIIIANPNAPTGLALSKEQIEKIIIKNSDKIVIIDEAYSDFSNCSVCSLVDKYENLLVVKTFSKSYSLAGLRLGYALGNKALIDGLYKIKDSFNSYPVNFLTAKIGEIAYLDKPYLKQNVSKINDTKEMFVGGLERIGFRTLNSATNFVFTTHNSISATSIFEKLKANNILVRHFNKPRIDNFLRITIGKKNDMEKVLLTLKSIVEGSL